MLWNGRQTRIYHYVATLEYPYTVGCFHGTPISTGVAQSGPPPGGPPGAGPPGGGPPVQGERVTATNPQLASRIRYTLGGESWCG